MMEPKPGQRLGRFTLISKLGQGRAGGIHLALDEQLRRTVALRILPDSGLAQPVRRDELLDDARRAMRLTHPGIAAIHEIGQHAGLDFMVVEYVRGATLRSLIDAAGASGIDRHRAIEYLVQIAEALAAAHEHGLAHGALGPRNVVQASEGRIKVLDFGLARLHQETPGIPGDLRALGLMAHEMLTGRLPPENPKDLVSLKPAELDRWLRAALSDAHSDRYTSAREVAGVLERARGIPRAGLPVRKIVAIAAAGLTVGVALAGLGYRLTRAPGSAPPVASQSQLHDLRLAPLLVAPGLDQQPAFSPDGMKLVYVHEGHLAIIPASSFPTGSASSAAPGPVPLTSGKGAESEPAWSPDGKMIAFTYERPDGSVEVCTIPSGGGPITRVVVGASSPSWSPDGHRIAFMQRGIGRGATILTVEADGRWSQPVTRPEAAYFHSSPAWSPDGRAIAFVKDSGGGASTEIWLAPADGKGDPRQLTHEAQGIFSDAPAWTPDGRWILYASNRGGTRNIWRIPSEGGEPVRLTTGPGEDDDPDVSPDGRRIVFSISRNQTGLFTFDRSRGVERTLVVDPVASLWGPAFSPDGRSIVYTRIDRAGAWDLFVTSSVASTPRQLTASGVSELWPRWSPDGTMIAFCTFGKGDDDIFLIPAAGGEARRLTEGGGDDWWPTWSPDGRDIVFSRTEGDRTFLYRVPASGGSPVRLSAESLTLPDFSPDGRYLAVARNHSFRNGVGILPVPTGVPPGDGELKWLSDTGGWPVFRPDGKAVGFVRLEPGELQSLWEVSVGGGEPRRIDGPQFTFWNFPFDYSPDGKTLTYTNNLALEGDLWMLEVP